MGEKKEREFGDIVRQVGDFIEHTPMAKKRKKNSGMGKVAFAVGVVYCLAKGWMRVSPSGIAFNFPKQLSVDLPDPLTAFNKIKIKVPTVNIPTPTLPSTGSTFTGYHVSGASTVSRDVFVRVLNAYGDPSVKPVAGQLYDQAVSDGINPAYILADFKWESSYGKAGRGHDNFDIGNVRWDGASGAWNNGGWDSFRHLGSYGWVVGLHDYDGLLHYWISRKGTDSLEVIEPILDPGANNGLAQHSGMTYNIEVAMYNYAHGKIV